MNYKKSYYLGVSIFIRSRKKNGEIMDLDKKVKRLKIFDEFIIAGGKNKLIFKGPQSKEHTTLKIDEKGIIDIHETEEGKVKKYRSIMKKGLKEMEEELQKQVTAILEESKVNIKDPKFAKYILAIPPADDKERFQKMLVHKGRDVILPKDVLERGGEQIIKDYLFVRMQDAMKIDFTGISYVLNESNGYIGALVKGRRDCYLITDERLDRLSRILAPHKSPA